MNAKCPAHEIGRGVVYLVEVPEAERVAVPRSELAGAWLPGDEVFFFPAILRLEDQRRMALGTELEAVQVVEHHASRADRPRLGHRIGWNPTLEQLLKFGILCITEFLPLGGSPVIRSVLIRVVTGPVHGCHRGGPFCLYCHLATS